jgi:hypothetical protein
MLPLWSKAVSKVFLINLTLMGFVVKQPLVAGFAR